MIVNEIFTSIQGEGKHIGTPQVFVRLTGCNLHCSWCDTQYAWEEGQEKTVEEVVVQIEKTRIKSVCITGGEPMLQKTELLELTKKLKSKGYEIILETNGTLYDPEIFKLVDCVSLDIKPPSSGEKSDEELIKKLSSKDQVKIVVADEEDLNYAKTIIGKTLLPPIIIQPLDNQNYSWLAQIVLDEKLSVKLIPQIHKIYGLK